MAVNQALVEAIYSLLNGTSNLGSGYGGTSAWSLSNLGLRTIRPAAVDDQNATTPIFTIAGGFILLTGLFTIRTVVQAGGASNIQIAHSTGPTNLHLAQAVTGDGIGTILSLAGDNGDAMVKGAGTGVANTAPPSDPGRLVATSAQYGGAPLFVLGVGNITVIHTAAAGTGSSRYVMFWIPLDQAATVVAV
jgi:hypothetical protein